MLEQITKKALFGQCKIIQVLGQVWAELVELEMLLTLRLLIQYKLNALQALFQAELTRYMELNNG
jgi:hypothetical protein